MTDEDDEVVEEASEIVVKCEDQKLDQTDQKSNCNLPLLPPILMGAPTQNGGFPALPTGNPANKIGNGNQPPILNSSEEMPPILRPPLPFLHPAFMSKMNPGLPTSVYETIAASWRR